MNDKYILDANGEPVLEPDLLKWASWYEDGQKTRVRVVACEAIGDCKVSTVFLAMDHRFTSEGDPILWETMIFGGGLDMDQDRCCGSREQALAMHARMVERVKARQKETKETK